MEFMSRGPRPQQPAPHTGEAPQAASGGAHFPSLKLGGFKDKEAGAKVIRIASVVWIFSIAILLLAVLAFVVLNKDADESNHIDKSKLQAIVLNNGQQPPYFGKIQDINENYVVLSDVYYLRATTQVQPTADNAQGQQASDLELVKLGCEIHAPEDKMVIRRTEVIYWENLKDDGKVATAIADHKKQYPGGQKCDAAPQQPTSSGQAAPTQSQTPAATPTTQSGTNQQNQNAR